MAKKITLKQIQLEKLTQKYHDAEVLVEMVRTGVSDTVLNPAYNKQFKAWVESIKSGMTEHAVFAADDETKAVTNTYELGGTGGVGSNILYMLEHFRHEYDENTSFAQPFFEFDKWDYSNLHRIPIKPSFLSKAESYTSNLLGTNTKNEEDIGQPVFLLACQMDIINVTFFGAFDIETRKQYHIAKIPFIGITHRDNSLQVTLNPTPITDADLSHETYGMVDVNFFIPAAMMSGIFMYLLQTKLSTKLAAVDAHISEYKSKKYKQQFIDIYTDQDYDTSAEIIAKYAPKMEKYTRYSTPEERDGLAIAKDVFAKMFDLLHTPEGRQEILDNVKNAQNIIPDSHEIQEIMSLWDAMDNKTLMTITQENVDKFLTCKNTQEALDYVDSLVQEL